MYAVLWAYLGGYMGRRLGNWLQAYMKYSEHSEAPDKFHFWAGVSTIAGALRRRVWIDQTYFQWTPNFYIIFVAPPGIVSKSTTLSIGMKLLREIPGIHFGPDAVTWQALTEALAESTEEVLMPDKMYHPMSCITIASSEFGTFLNPKDREMVDVLVSLWDGQLGVWEKRTKTQGADVIANPWINIAACTTPSWIAGNFPDYMIGGGFTSRCVFVYADYKRKLVAYPAMHVPQKEHLKLREDLIHDLEIISTYCGEFSLSESALRFGEEWYAAHYGDSSNALDNPRFAGYVARKQTHIHKLAMVLSVADRAGGELVIREKHLKAASEITTSLEADMPRVFSQIGLVGVTKHADEIYQLLRRVKRMGKRDLVRYTFNLMGPDELNKAMESLISAGYIKLENLNNEVVITFTGPEE